jgi:hypothetical protein
MRARELWAPCVGTVFKAKLTAFAILMIRPAALVSAREYRRRRVRIELGILEIDRPGFAAGDDICVKDQMQTIIDAPTLEYQPVLADAKLFQGYAFGAEAREV